MFSEIAGWFSGVTRGTGPSSGRGGGVYFPTPPVIFAEATLVAARTARDAYFTNTPAVQATADIPLSTGTLKLTLPNNIPNLALLNPRGANGNNFSVEITRSAGRNVGAVIFNISSRVAGIRLPAAGTIADAKALWEGSDVGGTAAYTGGADGTTTFVDSVSPVAFSGGADAVNKEEFLNPFRTNQYLAILLKPTGADDVIETYLPGNESVAYDNTKWVDRGSSSVTDAAIDARIATPARANNPTGRFVFARLPTTTARTSQIRTNAQIDARVTNWAQVITTALNALNALPASGETKIIQLTDAGASLIDVPTGGSGDVTQDQLNNAIRDAIRTAGYVYPVGSDSDANPSIRSVVDAHSSARFIRVLAGAQKGSNITVRNAYGDDVDLAAGQILVRAPDVSNNPNFVVLVRPPAGNELTLAAVLNAVNMLNALPAAGTEKIIKLTSTGAQLIDVPSGGSGTNLAAVLTAVNALNALPAVNTQKLIQVTSEGASLIDIPSSQSPISFTQAAPPNTEGSNGDVRIRYQNNPNRISHIYWKADNVWYSAPVLYQPLNWQLAAADQTGTVRKINLGSGLTGSIDGNGVLTIQTASAPAAPTHRVYAAWSPNNQFSAQEILAGGHTDNANRTVTIPATNNNGFLGVFYPVALGRPTGIFFDGNSHDISGGFTEIAQFQLNGVAYYGNYTTDEQNAAILGTGSRTVRLRF